MCMRTTTRLWEPETMSLTATASIIGVRCLAMLSTFSKQNLRAEPVQSDPLKDAERQPTGVIFHRFRHRRRRPRRISRYRVSVLPISRIPGPSLGDWPSTLRSPTHCVRDFPPTVFRNRFPAATERRRCWELNTRVSLCPRLAKKGQYNHSSGAHLVIRIDLPEWAGDCGRWKGLSTRSRAIKQTQLVLSTGHCAFSLRTCRR